ncbi:uncharacterized protein ARB_03031 [Trichophyton benhamiae CBS 112371]|uniref:Uncharacterized protein n=1 Tax=Arthroderma benhamiae (strain ATCC MYA-4681 / CBS 112371) TaxID=663331 RepID=D4B3J2_ARTBC|nr:uncharacterized protein ARB_03031 [Trichophyton benhamiae CBS 112371]EFE29690.1 hypothetical protein ARB_03031 [Trichophyton benhamiae CBS 112371]
MVFLKFSRAVADEAADGVDDDVIGDRDEDGNAAAELAGVGIEEEEKKGDERRKEKITSDQKAKKNVTPHLTTVLRAGGVIIRSTQRSTAGERKDDKQPWYAVTFDAECACSG